MARIEINPLTRQNGLMEIEAEIEGGRVVDAKSKGLLFRGMERIMQGRAPTDAPYLLERVCGICSTAHALAATAALEAMAPVDLPENAILIRNLTFAADEVQNHIRHFYFFALPDYMGTSLLEKRPKPPGDWRLSGTEETRLAGHYLQAMDASSKAHAMVGVFGARAPHQRGIVPGGVTKGPDADRIRRFGDLLKDVRAFVEDALVPDTELITRTYDDYYHLGAGTPNFLAYARYTRSNGKGAYLQEGFLPDALGVASELVKAETGEIKEDLGHAWFKGDELTKPLSLEENDNNEPDIDRAGAYSWIKAPRYQGKSCQVGPLARLWIAGRYRRGISTMDRLAARAQETLLDCQLMEEWIRELDPAQPYYTHFISPERGAGIGRVEAMRGALTHFSRVEGGQVAGYHIITPSAWNYSSRDSKGQRGPVEEALLGVPVADPRNPVEIGRVVRSFDPCAACAAQLIVAGRRLDPVVV